MTEHLADALKADGMARADAATDDWWRSCCDQAIRAAAATGLPFQSWDLVQRYGLPEPRDHHAWGPRFAAAARAGVIRHAGYVKSARPNTRRSVLSQWVGAQAVAGAA